MTHTLLALMQLLRPHQWVKNLLVFVPMLTSQSWNLAHAWVGSLIAFVCLSLLASAGYALNDALDVNRDRAHADKCRRPIASKALPRWSGFALFLSLPPLALALGWFSLTGLPMAYRPIFGSVFVISLCAYLLGTVLYSVFIKRVAMLDICLLTLLYVLRIIVGIGAIQVVISPWLLAFAGFVFLGLALMKRVIELQQPADTCDDGRPYRAGDRPVLLSAGVAASMSALLVLVLYTQSDVVRRLYASPDLILLLCPIMAYWLLRLWLRVGRDAVHSDPVWFAIRDPISYVCAALLLAIMLWAI